MCIFFYHYRYPVLPVRGSPPRQGSATLHAVLMQSALEATGTHRTNVVPVKTSGGRLPISRALGKPLGPTAPYIFG